LLYEDLNGPIPYSESALDVELRGFEPLTPSMRMRMHHSNGFERTSAFPVKSQIECQLMVLECVAR
jgi:hypothetical protein